MTTNQTPKRSTLDIAETQAKAEIEHIKGRLQSKFRHLETTANEMQKEMEDNSLFASSHLTKEAADIDLLYTRLKYATDWLKNIELLKAEDTK